MEPNCKPPSEGRKAATEGKRSGIKTTESQKPRLSPFGTGGGSRATKTRPTPSSTPPPISKTPASLILPVSNPPFIGNRCQIGPKDQAAGLCEKLLFTGDEYLA